MASRISFRNKGKKERIGERTKKRRKVKGKGKEN